MHTAEQLSAYHLRIDITGMRASLDDLLPSGCPADRFGIIVNNKFGSLGASLLIQAAIVHFYRTVPERRLARPTYPEIYLFHVGGRHGDHSAFDFWPPRKEVFVADAHPLTVLEAINDRAITRLAVPECGSDGDASIFETGPSAWAEQAAAHDRLTSSFAYAAEGVAADSDVWLQSLDPSFEENVTAALNPRHAIATNPNLPDRVRFPGPTEQVDVDRWLARFASRVDEAENVHARSVAARRSHEGTPRREGYRRLAVTQALRMMAASGEVSPAR